MKTFVEIINNKVYCYQEFIDSALDECYLEQFEISNKEIYNIIENEALNYNEFFSKKDLKKIYDDMFIELNKKMSNKSIELIAKYLLEEEIEIRKRIIL